MNEMQRELRQSIEGGVFRRLFDFSFSKFITTKIATLLYFLAMIVAAFAAIGVLGAGLLSGSGAMGVASLVAAPITFFLLLLLARVWLEMTVVLFRIADNTTTLVRQAYVEVPTADTIAGEPSADPATSRESAL